jgi:signal transduction histidine kinase
MLIVLIEAARKLRNQGNPYMLLYVIALGIYIAWGFASKMMFDDAFFTPQVFSNVFMVASQVVMLSLGYAKSRQREEELAAKTDLYRRVSHNLRTPLTIVSTNIQVARLHPDEVASLMGKSQSEIMKMAGMIDSALDDGEVDGA